MRADRLASGVEECAWVRCSAGTEPRDHGYTTGPLWIYVPEGAWQGYWLLAPAQSGQPGGAGLLRLLRPGG